jgi:hypothetical protein
VPVEHFKSDEAYRKWTAYRHMHGIPAPNLKTAVVAGKPHTVKHSTDADDDEDEHPFLKQELRNR